MTVTSSARVVADSAAEARISPGFAWVTAGVPVGGAVILAALFVLARPLFYLVQQEDMIVEWAQFGLCLGICVVAVWAAARLFRAQPGTAVALVGCALLYFFVAGEEISWGQRVFGLATPAELAEVNQQHETNLHNISTGIDLQLLFKLGTSLLAWALLAGVWWVRVRRRDVPAPLQRVVPPVVAVPGLLIMALYWVVAVLVAMLLPVGSAPISRFQEWAELSFYLSLVASLLCVVSRSGPRRGDRFWTVTIGVTITAVVVVFAIMTAYHGIRPGNV